MEDVDIVIRNGRIIDPGNNVDFTGDIAVKDGLIYAVKSNLQVNAKSEFDATGCLVTPGLIDCHVHCYQYATPLGINPDEQCLARGVTTVVDAGSSGASTFPGFQKFIVEESNCRVLCFLHIVSHGLSSAGCTSGAPGGEIDSLNQVDVDACVKCIESNRNTIVGIKVRLSEDIADKGKNEEEAFRRALKASELAKVPLMVHHTLSTVPVQVSNSEEIGCPKHMRNGDIYTHAFHGYKSSVVDPVTQKLYPDVVEAKEKGVLFDVGHGQGSFSWTVAETAANEHFYPDTISTDMHAFNHAGPVYDLTTVMSKFLHMGMPLVDVIRATTIRPAQSIGLDKKIGSLTKGNEADITVLKLSEVDLYLEDCQSQRRNLKKFLFPVATWRKGFQFKISKPEEFPNLKAMKENIKEWDKLLVKDKEKPTI